MSNRHIFMTTAPLCSGSLTPRINAAVKPAQTAAPAPATAVPTPQISEAERTRKEIHTLLKVYPELGTNQGYVAALAQLPAGIIASARNAGPITAKSMLDKALKWKDTLLEAYPDLAQRPIQFAVALETPEEYMKDRSGGKYAGKEYADRFGGVR